MPSGPPPGASPVVGAHPLRWSPRTLLAVAAVLAVMSAGSVWGSAPESGYQPGWYVPGSCITVYDYDGYPSLDCTYGYFSPGWTSVGFAPVPGYAGGARVLIIAAILLLVAGYRRGLGWLLRLGLVTAAAAPLLVGVRAAPGQLLWWLALGSTVLALDRLGLLRRRWRGPAAGPQQA